MNIVPNIIVGDDEIFQRLVNDIHSLKQMHEIKAREFDVCNDELQTVKNDLQAARQTLEEQNREIKSLHDSLLKEQTDNLKHKEENTSLKKKLDEEKEGTRQLEKHTKDLRKKVQNEHENLGKEIKTLKETNENLLNEKTKLTEFLTNVGNQVNFRRSSNVDIFDSSELQNLFQHIQDRLTAQEKYVQKLQHLLELEKAVNETEPEVGRTSSTFQTCTQAAPSQASQPSTKNVPSSSFKPSLSSNERNIEHYLDTNFNLKDGFRCSCGKIVQHKQSLKNHIRRVTEKLEFQCRTCKRGFLHKSGLEKHFQSAKCKMARKQNKMRNNKMPISRRYQERKLKCSQHKCYARFLELAELKMHLRRLHKIKDPLSKWGTACKSCGKLLKNWAALKEHINTTQCT